MAKRTITKGEANFRGYVALHDQDTGEAQKKLGPQVMVPPSHDCMMREGLRVPRRGWHRWGYGLTAGGKYIDSFAKPTAFHPRGCWVSDWFWLDNRLQCPFRIDTGVGSNAMMGWNFDHNDPAIGQAMNEYVYAASYQFPVGLTTEIKGEFVIASEPATDDDGWFLEFSITVGRNHPLSSYDKNGLLGDRPFCYQVLFRYDPQTTVPAPGFRWAIQIARRNGPEVQEVIGGAPGDITNAMGYGTGARRVPFRITMTHDTGTNQDTIMVYLNNNSSPTYYVQDEPSYPTGGVTGLEYYCGLELIVANPSTTDAVNDLAEHFGYDNVEIEPDAASVEVHAMAIVQPPDVQPYGPDFSAYDRLVLVYAGQSLYMAPDDGSTLEFTRIWSWPLAPAKPVEMRPHDKGVVITDGANPPLLCDGWNCWQIGLDRPGYQPGAYANAAQPGGTRFPAETTWEWVYTFWNEHTNEESLPSAYRSVTTPGTGFDAVRLRLRYARTPNWTHFRLYRRRPGVGTVFRRVAEIQIAQKRYRYFSEGGEATAGSDIRYDFQGGGVYMIQFVGGEYRLSKTGGNPDWTTTTVAVDDKIYVTWTYKDGFVQGMGPYTVTSVVAGYVVLTGTGLYDSMYCIGTFIYPEDKTVADLGADFVADGVAVGDKVVIVSGSGATQGEYTVVAGGVAATELTLTTSCGESWDNDCHYKIYHPNDPEDQHYLYAEDNVADADVPQDEDSELPTDTEVGPCPLTPYAFEWFGRRGFWVGSEWRELFHDVKASSGRNRFTVSEDQNYLIGQVKHGDLIIFERSAGPTFYRVIAVKASTGEIVVDRTIGDYDEVEITVLTGREQHQTFRWSTLNEVARNPLVNEWTLDGPQEIVAMRCAGRRNFLFRRRSICGILGTDPASWVVVQLEKEVGALSPRGIAEKGTGFFVAGHDGIYFFNGQAAGERPITDSISYIWLQRIPKNQMHLVAMIYDTERDMLWVAYPDAATWNNKVIGFHVTTGTWTAPFSLEVTCWASYADDYGRQRILFGTRTGKVGLLFDDSDGNNCSRDEIRSEWVGCTDTDADVSGTVIGNYAGGSVNSQRSVLYDSGKTFKATKVFAGTHVLITTGSVENYEIERVLDEHVVTAKRVSDNCLGTAKGYYIDEKVESGAEGTTVIGPPATLTHAGKDFVAAGVIIGDFVIRKSDWEPFEITNVTATVLTIDNGGGAWEADTSVDYLVTRETASGTAETVGHASWLSKAGENFVSDGAQGTAPTFWYEVTGASYFDDYGGGWVDIVEKAGAFTGTDNPTASDDLTIILPDAKAGTYDCTGNSNIDKIEIDSGPVGDSVDNVRSVVRRDLGTPHVCDLKSGTGATAGEYMIITVEKEQILLDGDAGDGATAVAFYIGVNFKLTDADKDFDNDEFYGKKVAVGMRVRIVSGTGIYQAGSLHTITAINGSILTLDTYAGASGAAGDVTYELIFQDSDSGATYTAEWYGGWWDAGMANLKLLVSVTHELEADYGITPPTYEFYHGLYFPDGTKMQALVKASQTFWKHAVKRRQRLFGDYIGWTYTGGGQNPFNVHHRVRGFSVELMPLRYGQ